MDYELDHIGIAVKSLAEGSQFYKAMGWTESTIEEVPSENVRVQMFELQNQSRIELLEATSEASPIAKFLERKGPGIHHICMRVKDIRATMAKLKAQGVTLIHDEPFKGAHNCQVAFVHPKSAGGVLVELSQPGGAK